MMVATVSSIELQFKPDNGIGITLEEKLEKED